jgi:hypothetical protein
LVNVVKIFGILSHVKGKLFLTAQLRLFVGVVLCLYYCFYLLGMGPE